MKLNGGVFTGARVGPSPPLTTSCKRKTGVDHSFFSPLYKISPNVIYLYYILHTTMYMGLFHSLTHARTHTCMYACAHTQTHKHTHTHVHTQHTHRQARTHTGTQNLQEIMMACWGKLDKFNRNLFYLPKR